MSFGRTSKSEDVQTNPNYMRKLEFKGCHKVGMKYVVNLSRFLNMQNEELQKLQNSPLVQKLRQEINKKDLNLGHFTNKFKSKFKKSPSHRYQAQEHEVSDDNDHDYESRVSDNDRFLEEDYVCPIGERCAERMSFEDEYEAPPSTDMASQFRITQPLEDSDYIDAKKDRAHVPQRHFQGEAVRSLTFQGSGPSLNPYNCHSRVGHSASGQNHTTAIPFKAPAAMAPKVDRSTKPVWLMTGLSKASQTPVCPSLSAAKFDGTDELSAQSQSQFQPSINQKVSRVQQPKITNSDPVAEQDLEPSWYIGSVTRGYAESCLRAVNKDGAFLVRNSSKCSSNQPYTLMVLYQDKVFNIQVRYNREHKRFSLGTGLNNNEDFETVGAIIQHHMQIPLLLIEANYNGPRRHCLLLYPAVLQW